MWIYDPGFHTQYSKLLKPSGLLVDDIFKFENLKISVQKISKKINSKLYLSHHNPSKIKIAKESNLSYKTKDFLYDIYKDDFEQFYN